MARIDMTLDMTRAVEVTDDPVGANSYENVRVIPHGNGVKRECRECRRRYTREYRTRMAAA